MAAARILFIDTGVELIDVLLANVTAHDETILLDGRQSVLRQMALALQDRQGRLDVHVLAHGRPGEVAFASGPLSHETIEMHADDLAAIGETLAGGELRLWT